MICSDFFNDVTVENVERSYLGRLQSILMDVVVIVSGDTIDDASVFSNGRERHQSTYLYRN